jgi:hypothetical protein
MECLIAIGIGIALIGIGTAVYFTVRDRAYQTMCASNLRQIYDAAKMYSLDHDGFLPPYHNSWHCACPTCYVREEISLPRKRLMKYYDPVKLLQAFTPYTKDINIWFCPSDHNARQNILCSGVDRRYASYEWMPDLLGFMRGISPPHLDFPTIVFRYLPHKVEPIPPQAWLARDAVYGVGEICDSNRSCNDRCEGKDVPAHSCSLGHFRGFNVLYRDGHVKWVLDEKIGRKIK